MARQSGRLTAVGIGAESTSGTAVTAGYWVPDMTFSHEDKNTTITDGSSFGRLEDAVDSDIVTQWSDGTLTSVLRDAHIGAILKAVFGTSTSVARSAPNAAVYDTTFTVANNNSHPSLTLYAKDPNQDIRFAYGMVDKFTLNYDMGKLIEYSVDFKAKRGTTTTSTPAYVTENKFRPQDVTFKLATTVAGLGAAPIVKVKTLKLTITKGTDVEYVLGSVDVDSIYNTIFSVQVDIGLLYDDLTYKNYDFNNTKQAASIALTRTDTTIGSTANPGLAFTFDSLFFDNWTKQRAQNQIMSQTITMKGLYSFINASMAKAILTNTIAAY
jgi:hypothetical protein